MVEYGLPVLYALALWWGGTIAVLYLDGLPRPTFGWTMTGATVLLLAALVALWMTRADTTAAGAYVAVTAGVLVWAWLEVSFYTGYVTGPRRHRCASGCRGWRHFRHALAVSLWHEVAMVVLVAAVTALTWQADNRQGLWTLLVLAGMHESARLNVFLGVRNLNAEFLPAHMDHLASFLRRRPMNALFPLSVTVGTVVLVLLVQAALAPGAGPAAVTGLLFAAAMMALALLEHWFLILPLPTERLWAWGLRSRRPAASVDTAEHAPARGEARIVAAR